MERTSISDYETIIKRGMKSALPAFIGSLQKRGLADLDILGDSEEHFNNRLKLQKYVYLAKYYGLDMGYNYGLYLHGPYSQELTHDYYTLARDPQLLTNLPKILISDKFFELVTDKDIDWLEVASTLLSLNGTFKDRKHLLDMTTNRKQHIPSEKIETVLTELERLELIRF